MFVRAYVALKCLGRDEEGASAVEYGLILGLIAVAIILVLGLLGTGLDTLFTKAETAVTGAAQ
ncbi:hypothetical protein B1810_04335 [Panacagrimonas perspica]|nr:hypothetical protein B1810_04335 [Panacagrimonas perspica]